MAIKFSIDPKFGWSPKHTWEKLPYGTYPIWMLGFISLAFGLMFLGKSLESIIEGFSDEEVPKIAKCDNDENSYCYFCRDAIGRWIQGCGYEKYPTYYRALYAQQDKNRPLCKYNGLFGGPDDCILN